MKTIKITMMALMMCFAINSFGQVNPKIEVMSYPVTEIYYEIGEGYREGLAQLVGFNVTQNKTTKIFTLICSGEYKDEFYVKYVNTIKTNSNKRISKYIGKDQHGEAITMHFITLPNSMFAKIIVFGKNLKITYDIITSN